MGAVVRAVVGVVEIVAGVVLEAVPGGQAFGALLINAGVATELSVVGELLNAKPSAGGAQTKWKADPYAGMPYAMGRTLVAGNIVARLLKGNYNEYEGICTVLSVGPIQSIDTTFMNKTTMTWSVPATGADTKAATNGYAGWIWQHETLGLCPAPYAPGQNEGFPLWGSSYKLSGLAAVFNTLNYNANDKNTLTTEPQPGWIIHGVYVYDPRQDSTYPGGSGSCRALNESTYVWSENPHLHALTWALGRWQNGVRVAGIGLPISAIDMASFVEGANLDDARGWKIGGQVFTRPDTPWNSLKAMLQAGGSHPVLNGGVLSSINRAPRVSLATIGPGDVVGKCTFAATQPRRTRLNGILPQYRSEAHDWELVTAQIVQVPSYVSIDGDERTQEISYPLVQQVNQAAQLAAYDICDAREAGPGQVPLKPAWLNYKVGDCVTFAPETGFSLKVLITGRAIDAQSGTVTYTLRGETDSKHSYALGLTGTAPAISTLAALPAMTAPSSDWSLTGTTIISGPAGIPALLLNGAAANNSASAILVAYRPYTAGLADDANWIDAGTYPPTTAKIEITSVTPQTAYQVSVIYRVQGSLTARAILGPVTSGNLYPAGYLQSLIAGSYTSPATGILTAHDAGSSVTVSVASHTRIYSDESVSISGVTSITGLAYSTTYYAYYDDAARAGGAVTVALTTDSTVAANSTTNPARHGLGTITTPAAAGADTTGGGIYNLSSILGRLTGLR